MDIKNRISQPNHFSDIRLGDAFIYNDLTCIRIYKVGDALNVDSYKNAVDLFTGTPLFFKDDTPVQKVKATLILE